MFVCLFSEPDSRFHIIGQGTLEISNVQESDAGSYTCRATNQEDSLDADASLTVHGKTLSRPMQQDMPHE